MLSLKVVVLYTSLIGHCLYLYDKIASCQCIRNRNPLYNLLTLRFGLHNGSNPREKNRFMTCLKGWDTGYSKLLVNTHVLLNRLPYGCYKFRWQRAMAMIFPVRPDSLCIGKFLAICWNEPRRSICIPTEDIRDVIWCENVKIESPLDLKQWNVVQARYDILYFSNFSIVAMRSMERNRSFAAPQYCWMKFNSQWYLG